MKAKGERLFVQTPARTVEEPHRISSTMEEGSNHIKGSVYPRSREPEKDSARGNEQRSNSYEKELDTMPMRRSSEIIDGLAIDPRGMKVQAKKIHIPY